MKNAILTNHSNEWSSSHKTGLQIIQQISLTLVFTVSLIWIFMVPSSAKGAAQWDFWIQKPSGWIDNKSNLGNELVKQIVEPGQNAFVEVVRQ